MQTYLQSAPCIAASYCKTTQQLCESQQGNTVRTTPGLLRVEVSVIIRTTGLCQPAASFNKAAVRMINHPAIRWSPFIHTLPQLAVVTAIPSSQACMTCRTFYN